MNVVVIGGAGRMGAWFARYFAQKGHVVNIFDARRKRAEEIARQLGVQTANDSFHALKNADFVLVSVPIDVTPEVLRELVPLVRKNMILAEIASLKKKSQKVLGQISRRGILTLSIHPLFGPGANDVVGNKIALIPVSNEKRELEAARQLFPEAKLLSTDADQHDRMMAVVLSLTHFVNVVYASALTNENLATLKKFAGPSFITQLTLAQSVLSEDPSNYFSMQFLNKSTEVYLRKLLNGFSALRTSIQNEDRRRFVQFFLKCRKWLYTDSKAIDAYQKIYSMLNVIEN